MKRFGSEAEAAGWEPDAGAVLRSDGDEPCGSGRSAPQLTDSGTNRRAPTADVPLSRL